MQRIPTPFILGLIATLHLGAPALAASPGKAAAPVNAAGAEANPGNLQSLYREFQSLTKSLLGGLQAIRTHGPSCTRKFPELKANQLDPSEKVLVQNAKNMETEIVALLAVMRQKPATAGVDACAGSFGTLVPFLKTEVDAMDKASGNIVSKVRDPLLEKSTFEWLRANSQNHISEEYVHMLRADITTPSCSPKAEAAYVQAVKDFRAYEENVDAIVFGYLNKQSLTITRFRADLESRRASCAQ